MTSLTLLTSLLKVKASNNTIDNAPNNPFPKFERMATSVVYTKEHTLPFTLENLEQLWTLRSLGYASVLRMRARGIVRIEV
jgi:hypothetical protein